MKAWIRMAAVTSLCAVLFGVSTVLAKKPTPPQPVLCGCACPDGSIVITHAPDANSCPIVCATACSQTS